MAVSLPVLEYVGRPFLQRLSEASRHRVLRKSVLVRYQPGEIVYQPGDPDRVEVLQSGFARLYLSSPDGRETTVRYMRAGDLVGSLLVMGLGFEGSMQIIVGSSGIRLDIASLRDQLEVDPELADALAADLACRYSHTVRAMAVQAFGSIVQRIAFDLLDRSCREQLASKALETHVSHEELANSIGSVRQVVSRGLAELRGEGLIGTGHRCIQVLDPIGLEALAQSVLS